MSSANGSNEASCQQYVEQLERSEARYRSLIDGSIQGILIHVGGVIRAANPALGRMLGYDNPSRFVGQSIWPFIAPEDRQQVEANLGARLRHLPAPARFSVRVIKRGGAILWMDCVASRIVWDGDDAILVTMLDITEKRLLEEQFRQTQKMEAVGRLAGGVAHDFNNLLTAINGFSELLLEDIETGDPRREDVVAIYQAAQTGATLTRQLLSFSRQQVLAPRLLSMNEVVKGSERMLRRLMDADIELVTSLATEPCWIRADAGAIEQILMNLAVNARDAMPDGGSVLIATASVDLDDTSAREHLCAPGPYVILLVTDSGIGMDEQTRSRMFEPFFTTKAPGWGTGLGLATVYGIVQRQDGFIRPSSALGKGTTFEIFLPRAEAPAPAGATSQPTEPPRGTETVLLVEDAAAVRATMCEVLGRLGYTVLEAPDGEAALTIASKHHGPIDLLLTDLVMPKMGGRQLTARLLTVRPSLAVLLMSGYSADQIAQRASLGTTAAYLQKPFTMEQLAQRVREALDAR